MLREAYWPLFGLRVRTPRLELRYPDDGDVVALAEVAARGVHDPDFMPFEINWTDVEPPQQQRNTLQFFWRQRAEWTVDDWTLSMATVVDGTIVGSQGVAAKNFSAMRAAGTGSWLGQEFQGKGIGKEMRAAMLHLVFAGLGADVAISGAWHDNAPSLGVSRSLGYEENGESLALRRGVADRQIGLRLPRESWEARRRDDIEIVGLEACLPMFGAV
jgi:RimJ/RimL family protein N-acetyltransferase